MSLSRAPAEPDVTRFKSTVQSIQDAGRGVILEETYFYPEGGGQPADRGYLDGTAVDHVEQTDAGVIHHLAEPLDINTGDNVRGQIDPDFRQYCRRAHTASHVLYGAGRRLFDSLGYGGFDIDEDRVRVDLRVPGEFGDAELVELQRLTNRCVWDSRQVRWEEVSREDALERDDVAFNDATEEGVMDGAERIRLVTVEDWDVAACGGTHVETTAEIGPVTVLDRSNPGEGLSRVEFAVGPIAIDRWTDQTATLRKAATTLGAPPTDVDERVSALQDRLSTTADERDALRTQLIEARIDALEQIERDGITWRLGTLDVGGPNAIGEAIRDPKGDVTAVVGRDGTTFVVVATAGNVETAAGDVIERVTDRFGGGGGGSPTFAQAGGLDASVEEVLTFLRDQ